MSQITLNPFDIDLIAMVEQIAQVQTTAQIDLDTNIVHVKLSCLGMTTRMIHAIETAVKGRAGERFVDFSVSRSTIFISFKKNPENVGSEMRYSFQEPDLSAGTTYARTLKEVKAIQFARNNQDAVVRFTGGGNVTIPRSIEGVAIYEFPTENGMLLTVKDGEMIVNDNGRFYNQSRKEFLNDFEEK